MPQWTVGPTIWTGAPRAPVLATGQTTQYSSEADDGFYEAGLAKSYTVLSTGAQSGTSNIDLAHYTGTDIGFADNDPAADTITSTVLDFTTLFVAGDVVVISGSASNNGAYTIAGGGVAANVLTLTAGAALVTEAAGASVTISKRESHSNNCVLDNNSGLTWSRYVSDKMGTASDGKMPWTGQLYDIFAYAAAANTASLGGYSDWRVANIDELFNLYSWEAPAIIPDASFPSFPTDYLWTGTTMPDDTTRAQILKPAAVVINNAVKTAGPYPVLLVRGGV